MLFNSFTNLVEKLVLTLSGDFSNTTCTSSLIFRILGVPILLWTNPGAWPDPRLAEKDILLFVLKIHLGNFGPKVAEKMVFVEFISWFLIFVLLASISHGQMDFRSFLWHDEAHLITDFDFWPFQIRLSGAKRAQEITKHGNQQLCSRMSIFFRRNWSIHEMNCQNSNYLWNQIVYFRVIFVRNVLHTFHARTRTTNSAIDNLSQISLLST